MAASENSVTPWSPSRFHSYIARSARAIKVSVSRASNVHTTPSRAQVHPVPQLRRPPLIVATPHSALMGRPRSAATGVKTSGSVMPSRTLDFWPMFGVGRGRLCSRCGGSTRTVARSSTSVSRQLVNGSNACADAGFQRHLWEKGGLTDAVPSSSTTSTRRLGWGLPD